MNKIGFDGMPTELKRVDSWVCWEYKESGKKKKPLNAKTGNSAMTDNLSTWSAFSIAKKAFEEGLGDGVGFVLSASDPFAFVDLDKCRSPWTGELSSRAIGIVEQLASYTEVSPSGCGVHIFVEGRRPEGGRLKRDNVEMYDCNQYFTITGNSLEEYPLTIEERQDALTAIHSEYLSEPKPKSLTAAPQWLKLSEVTDTDSADIRLQKLYIGDWSDYESQSEGDLALCNFLSFRTEGDTDSIDRLFRDSGLYRDKWDEPHYADGGTYGQATIEKAVEWFEVPDSESRQLPDIQRKKSQATQLVEIGKSNELFRSDLKEPCAAVDVEDHREIYTIRSSDHKTRLQRKYYEQYGKAPSNNAVSSAIQTLEGIALFEGEEHTLHNRVARFDDNIYYDLADSDWSAIRVNSESWSIDPKPPILFRRLGHQKPQVEPVRGGDLLEIFEFLHLTDEADKVLIPVYLVSSLIPDIQSPILYIKSSYDGGKSTCAKIIRELVDPSIMKSISLPSAQTEFVQQLSHNYCSSYDNVDFLTPWQSDAFCRAVTGEGFSKRALFTDDDDFIYSYQRKIILNGINLGTARADFLDRCILLKLEKISDVNRISEIELWDGFNAAKPRIFGSMLDALSKTLAIYPDVDLKSYPRMADFTRYGFAIAEALDIGGDNFLHAYKQNISQLKSTPVGLAITILVNTNGPWKGTASELLKTLCGVAERNHIKGLPKSPSVLTKQLKALKSDLQAAGLLLETHHRTAEARTISIKLMDS